MDPGTQTASKAAKAAPRTIPENRAAAALGTPPLPTSAMSPPAPLPGSTVPVPENAVPAGGGGGCFSDGGRP
jgi:hypothetical protein